MPSDLLLAITAPGTKTATFNSSALTLPAGSSWNEDFLRVIYSAASNASGSNTVTFTLDVSYDGGSTWITDVGGAPAITLSTTAQAGVVYLPILLTRQDLINANAANAPQIRLTGTIAGAGTSPTITVAAPVVVPTRD